MTTHLEPDPRGKGGEGDSLGNASDPLTFDEIYEKYSAKVLTIAYRFTRDEQTARDISQEVFMKIYESLSSYEGKSQVFTWIYRITVNHVINHLRKERRHRWLSLLEQPVNGLISARTATASTSESPHKILEQKERRLVVQSAIDSLPVSCRIPLVLHWSEGMSYQEIADALNVSLGAVEQRIHRAKKKLVSKLNFWISDI